MAEELTVQKGKEKEEFKLATVDGWTPSITIDQLRGVAKYINTRRNGVSKYTPLKCYGPNCSWYGECPLQLNSVDLPIDNYCPIELTLIQQMVGDMTTELKVEPGSVFDLYSVGAIAINQIMTKRALKVLSDEPFIIEHFRAMTMEGVAIFERRVHPAMAEIHKLNKSSQAIAADLMATRREKSKGDARTTASPSETVNKLKAKLKEVKRQAAEGTKRLMEHYGEISDAEYTLKPTESETAPGPETTEPEATGSGPGNNGSDPVDSTLRAEPVVAGVEDVAGNEPKPNIDTNKRKTPRRDPRTGVLIED